MRCPRCNRETKDGTVYCPGCGAPLTLRPEPPASTLDATLDLDRRLVGAARAPASPPAASPPSAPPHAVARPAAPQATRPPVAPPSTARPPVAPPPTARPPVAPPPVVRPTGAPAPAARPPPAAPAARPGPRPPPAEQPRRELPLSQMPRERRLDLEPDLPPPERRAILAPEAEPETSGTLEVDVGPVEIHLRRAPGWKRSLAWVLDGVPFAALFAFVLRVALDRLPHAVPLDLSAALELAGAEASGITIPILAGTLVLLAVYQVLAHGMSGATLGKRLVGIRVVGPDGKRPGLGRATVRGVLGAVSVLLLGMGVLLALFTRSGRALHDLLSRTWVVEAP